MSRSPGTDPDRTRGPVTLRLAAADDYPRLLDLWSRSGMEVSLSARESEAAYRQQLAHFAEFYLVAERAGEIVGVVLGTHDLRKGWINRLAVAPECRGQGIAGRLVEECTRRLECAGVELVAALVEPPNAASAAVFEKLGFTDEIKVRYFRRIRR